MTLTTRLSLLAALALTSACARSSADRATEVPGTPEPTRANNENVGLEPLGDPVDQVGFSESMKPTDGASAPQPGTEDTGNPGGGTVKEPPAPSPDSTKATTPK